ncbi:hypothetical protein BH18ACI3_BH18ACI3_17620 [soil metagenome]
MYRKRQSILLSFISQNRGLLTLSQFRALSQSEKNSTFASRLRGVAKQFAKLIRFVIVKTECHPELGHDAGRLDTGCKGLDRIDPSFWRICFDQDVGAVITFALLREKTPESIYGFRGDLKVFAVSNVNRSFLNSTESLSNTIVLFSFYGTARTERCMEGIFQLTSIATLKAVQRGPRLLINIKQTLIRLQLDPLPANSYTTVTYGPG